jgi:hypothetical protein
MSPMPPPMAGAAAGLSSLISVTAASVVTKRAEMLEAFKTALRVTLVGSTIPAFEHIDPNAILGIEAEVRLLGRLHLSDFVGVIASVVGDLTQRFVERIHDGVDALLDIFAHYFPSFFFI